MEKIVAKISNNANTFEITPKTISDNDGPIWINSYFYIKTNEEKKLERIFSISDEDLFNISKAAYGARSKSSELTYDFGENREIFSFETRSSDVKKFGHELLKETKDVLKRIRN